MLDAKRLARVHRVRTIQLGLAQADEARARNTAASEVALSQRIAQLADGVAPAATLGAGFSLVAAAHYRERLHRSAAAASNRVRAAEEETARAADATQGARRDQSAIEKLIERDAARTMLDAVRALQDAPAPARKVRHDPC